MLQVNRDCRESSVREWRPGARGHRQVGLFRGRHHAGARADGRRQNDERLNRTAGVGLLGHRAAVHGLLWSSATLVLVTHAAGMRPGTRETGAQVRHVRGGGSEQQREHEGG